MGRAMAPAALDTYLQHMKDLKRDGTYYDLILTGDLSRYGKTIMKDLLKEENVDVKVLETHDKWIGITYKEDTELAQAGFKKMTEDGVYPEKLWN